MPHNIKNETTPETVIKSRRRLLAGGVFAGITAPYIPVKWVQPVVESVLLPTHAQTSLADEPECRVLTIPAITFSCDALPSPSDMSTFYRVDDTSVCPVLLTADGPSDQSTIGVIINIQQDRILVTVSGGTSPGYELELSFSLCPDNIVEVISPAPPPSYDSPAEFSFAAQSGATWTATYDWGGSYGSGVWTLGPFTFAPAT